MSRSSNSKLPPRSAVPTWVLRVGFGSHCVERRDRIHQDRHGRCAARLRTRSAPRKVMAWFPNSPPHPFRCTVGGGMRRGHAMLWRPHFSHKSSFLRRLTVGGDLADAMKCKRLQDSTDTAGRCEKSADMPGAPRCKAPVASEPGEMPSGDAAARVLTWKRKGILAAIEGMSMTRRRASSFGIVTTSE